jgi:HD-GYP domain-containing protein (c-di-GMP phosphodiesterase class II)
MLASFSRALELRDPSLRGHGDRVAIHAERIARALGWNDARLAALRIAAVIHDLGKLTVPVEILRKRGRLTERELAEVRRHPAAGARMLDAMPALRPVIPYVLHHHERWDGDGYPIGRRAEEIPVEARILAVADAFDAMTSPRPYRPAISTEASLAEVERCSGSQFDPTVAQAFLASCAAELRAAAV